MQFNKLVGSILKESTKQLSIPALDGQREVYIVGVTGVGTPRLHWAPVRRNNPAHIFDHLTGELETHKFQQAFEYFETLLQENTPANLSIQGIYKEILLLKDVVGTFKVEVKRTDNDIITTMYFLAEVDTQYYHNKMRSDTPFKDFDF